MGKKSKIDPAQRKAIRDARRLVQQIAKNDANEAETRRRVEVIFEKVLGYDRFKHLSREHAVSGYGTKEHVDFAIQLKPGLQESLVLMVELKRVGIDVRPKHLRQACGYAINSGCEWVLLTNARQWRLYHVAFGQPPVTKLVQDWNLLKDDIAEVARKFEEISYKKVRRASLDRLWQRARVMAPHSVLAALFSPETLRACRRVLRRNTDVLLDYEDLVAGINRLLNEKAARELEDVKIQIPQRGKRQKKRKSNAREPEAAADKQRELPRSATEVETGTEGGEAASNAIK